jgi:TetR/AcrR family transcriptional repressor of nem operon
MRYPANQKVETRERIVATAARSFRKRGLDGQGIARLMKELGLTHGGFYRHFKSKEDLFVEAITRALEQAADRAVALAKAAPQGQELKAVIERYLSIEHAENVGSGCVIAALAPEIGRQSVSVRARIEEARNACQNRLLPFVPGTNVAEKRRRLRVLFPAMAGVLMTARAMTDPTRRNEILASARQFFIEGFASRRPG